MMNQADSAVPKETSQMVARCRRGDSRPRPKIHRPMNVDSRKNAARPSMASGAPKMSPTKREYCDQFMPNWNSWMSPVTTPTANEIRNSLPKNVTCRAYSSLPVR